MADTMSDINDPQVREHYSARMFEDSITASYFGSNLMDRGKWPRTQPPVQLLTEPGEQISYDLDAPPDQGQLIKLEERRDTICVGQVRRVYSDSKITSPQQVHSFLVNKYRRLYDQLSMLALSGRRGAVNADVLDDDILRVCKNNKFFTESDSTPIFYGSDDNDKSVATLDESDTLTLAKIKALCAYADALGGGGEGVVPLRPLEVNGGKYYVLLMHPYSVADLRKSTDPRTWEFIQEEARKAAEAVGSKSPIFKKAFGLIRKQVLLHQHELVPCFNDGGAAKNVEWSRAFLLGRQALIWAFGGAQPGRFDWRKGTSDHGNQTWVAAYTWLGIKRTTFKGKALGMIAVDHALSKKPAGV